MIINSFRQTSKPQIRCQLSFVLILGILFFNSASGASIPSKTSFIENKSKRNTLNVCLKDECEKAAREIREKIDEEVNPCDNFYHFACGNFMKSGIPSYAKSIDNFYIVNRDNILKLREILEDNINDSNSINIETPKRAYKACMNIADVEQNGLKRLMKVINDLGGMPIFVGSSWSEEEFDLFKVIRELRNMGYPSSELLSINTIDNLFNTTSFVLKIGKSEASLFGLKFTYNDTLEKIVDIFSALKADKSVMRNDIKDMLDFMFNLFDPVHTTTYYTRDLDTSIITNEYGYYYGIIKAMLPDNASGVVYEDVAYSWVLEHFMSITPKRVQANYVFWNFIIFSIRNMFVEITDKFQQAPRYERCIQNLLEIFPNLQAAYLQTYLTEKRLHSAETYVNNVQKALQDNIRKNEWLENDLKQNIIKKIGNIHKYVGHSDIYTESDDEMKRMFDESLKNGIYQEFYFKASKIRTDNNLARWGTPTDRNIWWMLQTDINAMYQYGSNNIYIPGSLLSNTLFNEDLPSYLNYAGLGFIAGHELSHSIDPNNIFFDEKHEFYINQSINNMVKYNTIMVCLAAQYENYTVGGMELNRELDLSEGITNVLGFKAAYAAYINSDMDTNKEPLLPELNYNKRQLFWIKAAHNWCAKFNNNSTLSQNKGTPYNQHEIRVLRSFSNLDEFSTDFNCPVGSNMNPKDKCLF